MDNWHIVETEFDATSLHHKETVFTIGNGYLGTRGAFEEGYVGAWPTTLIHGLFDDAPIVNTELVNAPNWIHLVVHVDGERFRMDRGETLAYRRELDMATGVLRREVRWRSPGGKTVELAFERFASLAEPHLASVRCTVTAMDFEGRVSFHAGLPGYMDNEGLAHWNWLDQEGGAEDHTAVLLVRTRGTLLRLATATHLEVEADEPVEYLYHPGDMIPAVSGEVYLEEGESAGATKVVATYTDRDVLHPFVEAVEAATAAGLRGYEDLREAHDAAWAEEWAVNDVTIEGDDAADRALRYNIFQLLIAASRDDEHVSIPAKALSGFGYRGHVFWDTEIFMLPLFTFTRPEIARNLLLYRYHTLAGARWNAAKGDYEGARYAWESAATGQETTPRWVPGPGDELIRIWTGDIEPHIVADVAYGVHQYWRVTGDDAFVRDYGAEILLDTARFWASRAEWNGARGRYELTDVIGPDEYHDHVDNNAYTNRMARWNLETALDVLAWLGREHPEKAAELMAKLDLTDEALKHWADVIGCIFVPYDPETGLFEQFEGFFDLEDIDLAEYEPREESLQFLLGIEETQGYQVIKQPDVLMLLYLLEDEYSRSVFRVNWDYYTPRTDLTYGSSLGPAIQAALAARMGEVEDAYRHFMHAALTDLEDARGNAGHGIHAAAAGGVWQAAVFGFGGLRLTDEDLEAHPRLPEGWTRLRFRIRYRGEEHEFDLRP
jgi:kojibiose phosphorylase